MGVIGGRGTCYTRHTLPSTPRDCDNFCGQVEHRDISKPLSSEYGTCETVKARFWPWLPGESS